MSTPSNLRDLVVLTADKNAQFAMRGLLARHQSLRIRQVADPLFIIHPQKDPGVFNDPGALIRGYVHSYSFALVIMDREGSGKEKLTRKEMEEGIEAKLTTIGWIGRSAAVVIDPELDVWVWADSPHVAKELGWKSTSESLRNWLRDQGFLSETSIKPKRPKEAMEAVLRLSRMPRSSAIYQELAKKVSLAGCTDPAFLKLRDRLQQWFPEN